MALAPRLELRQGQTLVMTPQLQQAIKILRMNNLELADFVATEVEKNPLLEIAPPPTAAAARPALAPGPATARPADAADFDTLAAETSLAAHLHAQIGAARVDAETAEAARVIADELEDDGYLRVPLAEVAARHRLRGTEAARGLALVQGCEPAGVGARSLGECLALQLRERDRLDPAMQALIDNLGLLAQGRTKDLLALCGVDDEDLAEMLAELRALDPKPGLRFATAPVQIAVPDVFVARTQAGEWTVELNTDTLPRVLVNNRYGALLGGRDGTARAFVSEMSAAANWLVRSLEQRARTILRVAGALVEHQQRFFEHGPRQLRPLTQRAVADRLGLHESTISRVTVGKYLSCDQGTFELRYLFSAAIQAMAGGEGFSAVAVQERIRHLVERETGARPLSDDKIVASLKGEGIDIARRTVAKYREGLGIPSSVERRRLHGARSGT
jgi:RNA polymerase sigma-54 factor